MAVNTTNLVFSYECQESSGNMLDDHDGHTATANGTPGTATGPGGSNAARSFTKANGDYCSVSDHADFAIVGNVFAIDFWIYPTSNTNIESLGKWSSGQEEWVFFKNGSDGIYWQRKDQYGGTAAFEIPGTSALNTWRHIFVCWDGDTINYALNAGTLTDGAGTSAGMVNGTGPIQFGSLGNSTASFDGRLAYIRLWNNYIPDAAERTELHNGGIGLPYASFGGGVHYTLACASGSYSLTGTSSSLKVNLKLACASGSYSLTGTSSSLKVNLKLACASGSYSLTGTSASLIRGKILPVASGSYAVIGTSSSLKVNLKLACASGSYSLTGTSSNLIRGKILPVASGSYAVIGTSSNFRFDHRLEALTTQYVYTASAATLTFSGAAEVVIEPEPVIEYKSIYRALVDTWNNK